MLILDLTIPGGMGGKDTLSRLKEIDQDVKAIVITGYSQDMILSNYEQYGFAGYLHKPFEIDKLSYILHEISAPADSELNKKVFSQYF